MLGITERRKAVVVGYGRLGGALRSYTGFPERGFDIVAVFDADPAKVGADADGLVVRPAAELEAGIREVGAEIAILATPSAVSQQVADRLVEAGIRAILNLAPVRLNVPSDVAVRQVCLSTDLQILSFYLAQEQLT